MEVFIITENNWSSWGSAVGLGIFFGGLGFLLYGVSVFPGLFI